ncbi:MAG TPA: hypothetical protein VKY26_00410 [Actinomycetota bacterium]|nr:hypothetical protein [Actinomycetota bacterium]
MRRLRSLVLAVVAAALIALAGGATVSAAHGSSEPVHQVAMDSTWG